VSATHVDISDVLSGMGALRARGRDLRPVLRNIREALKADVADHFGRNEGSEGAWAPYAPSTLARALAGRGMHRKRGKRAGLPTKKGERWIGNQLGRLKFPSAHKITMRRDSLAMTAKTGWAGVHQFGGIVGKGSIIPAREFMWASEGLQRAFQGAITDHLMDGWSGT
jgi:phage gpG-like protein